MAEITYRGHLIKVTRERCLGGWSQLYYTIVRLDDRCIVEDNFTTDSSSPRDYARQLKERVDAEIAEAQEEFERIVEEEVEDGHTVVLGIQEAPCKT